MPSALPASPGAWARPPDLFVPSYLLPCVQSLSSTPAPVNARTHALSWHPFRGDLRWPLLRVQQHPHTYTGPSHDPQEWQGTPGIPFWEALWAQDGGSGETYRSFVQRTAELCAACGRVAKFQSTGLEGMGPTRADPASVRWQHDSRLLDGNKCRCGCSV